MGSGKSFAGKQLAELMGYTFVDLDDYIEEQECCNISDIFAHRGEGAFRSMETYYLTVFSDLGKMIISTGGGTPCHSENMDIIKEKGVSIYLRCPTDLLYSRLKNQKENRPLIADKLGDELKQFISDKIEERKEHYEKADIVYDVTFDDDEIGAKLKASIEAFIDK